VQLPQQPTVVVRLLTKHCCSQSVLPTKAANKDKCLKYCIENRTSNGMLKVDF